MTGADLTALLKKHPVAFAAGFVAIACIAWWYVHSGEVDNARGNFEQADAEARKMAENIRNAAHLEEQATEMKEAGRQLESRLVRANQLATNLQFFYRLEKETGVKMIDARQQQIAPPKANAPRTLYSGVPFSVNVQGAYPQVLDFIRRIETGPHFGRFVNFTVIKAGAARGADAGGSADSLNVTITVEMLGTP